MTEPEPGGQHRVGAPGWYQDPDDPTRLRHWGGRGWTGRARSWPAWAIATDEITVERPFDGDGPTLEGPVRPTPMTASRRATVRRDGPSAGSGRSRSGPTGRTTDRAPLASPAGNAPTWSPRPLAPAHPARRPLVAFVAIVAVAVLLLGFTVSATHRNADVLAVASDGTFVSRANTMCAGSLPQALGSIVPGAPAGASASASLDRGADRISALADQIAAIPTTSTAGGPVLGWLAGWHRFADDRRQMARYLRTHPLARSGAASGPTTLPPGARGLDDRGTAEARQADSFAVTNGLGSCTLLPAGSQAVSPIPG